MTPTRTYYVGVAINSQTGKYNKFCTNVKAAIPDSAKFLRPVVAASALEALSIDGKR